LVPQWASGRILPDLTKVLALAGPLAANWICPASSDTRAGPPPENGTWVMGAPDAAFSISMGMCMAPYTPDDP